MEYAGWLDAMIEMTRCSARTRRSEAREKIKNLPFYRLAPLLSL